MMDKLSRLLITILKLPPEPPAPFGEERSLRVFRASPQFLKYQYVLWGIGMVVQCVLLLCGLVALIFFMYTTRNKMALVALGLAAGFVLVAFATKTIISLLSMQLNYKMRWYKVTDRSLRIREGVIFVREMTMTFVNIQNIEISQGPIQRLLGISDVKVQSAGGGGAMTPHQHDPAGGQQLFNMHVGYFRGVDNAAEIMTLMQERLKKSRSAGLGDHDDVPDAAHPATAPQAFSSNVLAAARDVLEESRALKAAIGNLNWRHS